MYALLWAIPAVLALALVLRLLPPQHAQTALRSALAVWIAAILVALPLLLSRS
ncbi:hypothetical protein LN042_11475 [Kitasatospora sp. RB6PN24]|uniref:hypothetical protein n=1 Tax=Kitasatospora humi TaxID=2893891 RepID=UPI001E3CC2AA|nr:hypothetical protein [Kitasatospora humi]MCC9307709.1 hypothetical protein [Kitasatospora humi]